jgi:serine/threonine protein kinase/tetratricopeptide (TPR) repeat protein
MTREFTFGAGPERLRRLLFEGLEEPEGQEDVTHSRSDDSAHSEGERIGCYRLVRTIGEGGMGIVYLAEQVEPMRRQVALKIIKPGMDSRRVLARFEAEQQALALMEHPHVARVYDAGLASSGRPYFVMEYVKGIPITEHCDKYRLTIEERLHLFLYVCQAVQHAHQKGIIHRDLKPSNILVSFEGDRAVPKVIDFGVVRAISQPLTERTLYTEQGQLIGTPEYMSPEQADLNNQDIDTRSDVYSLGIILYELLAGVLPFDPKSFRTGGIEHIRKVICEEDPKTPSTQLSRTSLEESTESARRRQTDLRSLQRSLRGDLDWITLKALEKDRTRRYPTVDALAADIHSYLNHQPVNAAPPGTLYHARKFIRRHRQTLVVLGMTTLTLLGVLLITIMSLRAARERNYAQSLEHRGTLAEAQVLTENRKYNEALASLGPLLNSPHVGREATLAHAKILLEQKNLDAAVVELENLLDKPDEIAGQAHFLLANIYYEGDPYTPGKTEEYNAKYQFHSQQAERLIAGTAEYYFLQARATPIVKTRLDLLAHALHAEPSHYDSLRERASIYHVQKDYQKMGEDASQIIGVFSTNPTGHLLRAIARREQDRFEEAIEDHNEAIALAPRDATLYAERCQTYMRMGEYASALVDAQQAAELEPGNLIYQFWIFAARVAHGQYEQAEQEYRRLIGRSPTDREYSPFSPVVGAYNTKDWFDWLAAGHASDAQGWKRPWWPPPIETQNPVVPASGAFWSMREAAGYYDRLARYGRRIGDGGSPSWSPDGTKIAYSMDMFEASVTIVLDLNTGIREILAIPGSRPQWSPDGQYIAFVRRRENLPPDAAINWPRAIERRRVHDPLPDAEEVWIIELADNHNFRRIAKGKWPTWSSDSKRIYFASRPEAGVFSWVSVEEKEPTPIQVLTGCGYFPVISPNEQYIADADFRCLRILDAQSGKQIIEWLAPAFPARGLLFNWSSDSRELNIGGFPGAMMGLWILDRQTGEAHRMMDGPVFEAKWSPDHSKVVVALGVPYFELWLFDLDPNQLTAEALVDGATVEEHCHELIEYCTRGIQADPNYIHNHLVRTDAALWIGDSRAPQFLEELERAFQCTPYHAGGCAARAQAILSSPTELRKRLLRLALLLARKAVEKEPENADFLMTMGEALYHTEDRENAEVTLLRALELSIAASDTKELQTTEIVQSLIQLYEVWGKPEKAEQWRAKLPQP